MVEWFWIKDGQKCGPVDAAGIRRMAQTGQLDPTDLIWREGLADSIPASRIKGLFPESPLHAPLGRQDSPDGTGPSRKAGPAGSRRHKGIVRYRCDFCGAKLESGWAMAGKQDKSGSGSQVSSCGGRFRRGCGASRGCFPAEDQERKGGAPAVLEEHRRLSFSCTRRRRSTYAERCLRQVATRE